MQAQQVLARDREQAERVVVAHVGLDREWNARNVGKRLDVLRAHAGGIKLPLHMRHLAVGARDRRLQPAKLQRFKFAPRHGLGGAVEHVALILAVSARHAFPRSEPRSVRPWP